MTGLPSERGRADLDGARTIMRFLLDGDDRIEEADRANVCFGESRSGAQRNSVIPAVHPVDHALCDLDERTRAPESAAPSAPVRGVEIFHHVHAPCGQ